MIISLILWYLNIITIKKKRRQNPAYIHSLLQSITLWTLYLFVLTEVCSLFHMINFAALAAAWGGLDLILLFLLLRRINNDRKLLFPDSIPIHGLIQNRYRLLLGGIGILVGYFAIQTVPYNWDSMSYRLSRVASWSQNGSVEHFATHILRSIANPPLGEFVLLHIYTLCRQNDLLLNLVQYFSYLACSIAIYGISKRLRLSRAFCFLSALLFMSMPIAFAEAINTQVDLFATVWLLCFVYHTMDFLNTTEPLIWSGNNMFKAFIMGLCVAFGYLAKPSTCIAMVIWGICLTVYCLIRKDRFTVLARLAGCAFFSMAAPLLCEIARNLKTFHAISSPIAGSRQLIGTLQPTYVIVNFFKNFTHNLPMINLNQLTGKLTSFIEHLASFLHVSLDDPAISEDGQAFMLHAAPNYGHDTAINPLIVWLMSICLIYMVIRFRTINWKSFPNIYSITAAVSFLVFCAVLRWEPFVTRYMVSFLALLCPMIAVQLQNMTENHQKRSKKEAVLGILIMLCLLDLINMSVYHYENSAQYGAGWKPNGYFVNRWEEYEPAVRIAQLIEEQKYDSIGFVSGGNDYEYPYWQLLKNRRIQLEHVNVQNESGIYTDPDFQPQCIIWLGALEEEPFVWNGQTYDTVEQVAENRYLLTAES